jgi:hypothetical protein
MTDLAEEPGRDTRASRRILRVGDDEVDPLGLSQQRERTREKIKPWRAHDVADEK